MIGRQHDAAKGKTPPHFTPVASRDRGWFECVDTIDDTESPAINDRKDYRAGRDASSRASQSQWPHMLPILRGVTVISGAASITFGPTDGVPATAWKGKRARPVGPAPAE